MEELNISMNISVEKPMNQIMPVNTGIIFPKDFSKLVFK